MRSMNPGNGVDEIVIVLFLPLVGLGRGAELESGTVEREFVHVVREIVRRAANPQRGGRRSRGSGINGRVVDVHKAKAELVHQCRRKEMRLGYAQEAVPDG